MIEASPFFHSKGKAKDRTEDRFLLAHYWVPLMPEVASVGGHQVLR